ncbi:MAG: hypothetical protein LBU27_06415 [Candidatus Peribacteria bacterium]|jgi:hypothetical protein|nr:hypothetical protein [Candidatus Peribacteria bacterium]
MDNIITNYNSMLNDWYNDDFELNTTNRYTLTVNDWRNSQSGASLPKFELIFPSIGCVRGDGILVSDKDVYQAQDELTNAGAIGLARVPCYADEEALEQ